MSRSAPARGSGEIFNSGGGREWVTHCPNTPKKARTTIKVERVGRSSHGTSGELERVVIDKNEVVLLESRPGKFYTTMGLHKGTVGTIVKGCEGAPDAYMICFPGQGNSLCAYYEVGMM